LTLLGDVHHDISDLLRDTPLPTATEMTQNGLPDALKHIVEEEFKGAFDQVTWEFQPEAMNNLTRIPDVTVEVLFYASREVIRNAAHHARGEGKERNLHLSISLDWKDGLEILVEDNGVGIERAERGESVSGKGLSLHSTMLSVVGGSLEIESIPGKSTRARIFLPTNEYTLFQLDGS